MGFSVNLSKIPSQPPRRSTIYGYEFMDIVMDSPKSELRKSQIEGNGLAWAPLLSDVNCLLCSDLGDAIVAKRSPSLESPCNRLPAGLDLMAASMHSIERLCKRYGGSIGGEARILANNHYLLLVGNPFQQCQHHDNRVCCWNHPQFLQEIQARQPSERTTNEFCISCLNGALVFGGGKRVRALFEIPLWSREVHQPQIEAVFVPAQQGYIYNGSNMTLASST